MRRDQLMLKALLVQGTLTAQEREAFESMWDQTYKTRKLSHKQMAWIEKAFFKQGLDRPKARPAKQRSPKVGYIYDVEAKRKTVACTLAQFKTMCPNVEPGSALYQRVETFFRNGGERFELRPGTKPQSSK